MTLLVSAAHASAATVDGFVTKINSPTEFYVGRLQIALDANTNCEVLQADNLALFHSDAAEAVGYWTFYAANTNAGGNLFRRSRATTRVPFSCDTLRLVVGGWVHVEGIQSSPGRFRAARVVATTAVNAWQKAAGDTLLEEPSGEHRYSKPEDATIWIDGYPVFLMPQTEVFGASDQRTFGPILLPSGRMQIDDPGSPRRLDAETAGEALKKNDWASYSIDPRPGGYTAKTLTLWPNHIDVKERTYLDSYAATVRPPDYAARTAGSIQMRSSNAIAGIPIVPAEDAQRWLSALGTSLVPQYQRDIPDGDPAKINFQFYLAGPFSFARVKGLYPSDGRLTFCWEPQYGCLLFNRLRPHTKVDEVIALPNGIVLIPESVLPKLHNEAQLAALLASAIAQVLQKQDYHSWMLETYRAKLTFSFNREKTGMSNKEYMLTYSLCANAQAVRIGTRQMLSAGYDIREAPFAWALEQDEPVSNPVVDSKSPELNFPWFTTYSFNYLSQYYSDVDYSKLKKGESEYAQFLDELRKADPEAFVTK